MLDIIIFAAITIFVFSRLFKALGDTEYKRERNEEIEKIYEEILDINSAKIEEMEHKSALDDESLPAKIKTVFVTIRKSDPSFASEKFVGGAKKAFEIILTAFSQGEVDPLRELLDKDTFKDFEGEIERRKQSGQIYHTTVVGVNKAEIVEAEMEGTVANITVKFLSEQIKMIKDAKDQTLLSGSSTKINLVDDVWTFAKDLNASSRNWKLVSTDAGE
ncbi:MAG: Tim44/TimA family putative adaptor protein [Rickettsiales bacterium]